MMSKNGYDVFIARNGTEALDILQDKALDLVVLDIMMPDVDGYELCRYIRTDECNKDAGIIFLSAKSQPTDVKKGMDLGADRYITKPFSTKKLMNTIRELLESENN